MSRIGKSHIALPENVEVVISDSHIHVKGPKGKLEREIPLCIKLQHEANIIKVLREGDSKRIRALHGLTRQLIANMIKGVTEGFRKVLVVEGLGYKAELREGGLFLSLGFSHPLKYCPPAGINLGLDKKRIIVEGIDKELVGQTAAIIKEFRPVEVYKRKGIYYEGEHVRKKAGKVGRK
jgi:large subunit ribosomal protein L6